MMESVSEIPSWAMSLVGVLGGSLGTGYIARLMFERYLTENDEKHKQSSEDIKTLLISTEVIKSQMAQVTAVVADVRTHDREIAVIKSELEGARKDITKGFSGVRDRMEKLKQA